MKLQPSRRLAKATAFSPRRRSRAMRSKVGPWKRGEQLAITRWSRPRSSTASEMSWWPSVPHMNWFTATLVTPSMARACAARSSRSSTPLMLPPHWHRKTPALIGATAFVRAPMRSSSGSTSCECEPRPQSLSGSAPSASARSCCTCRCTNGYCSWELASMMLWWRSNWMAQLGHMCTQHVDLLLGQAAQLLARHGHGDRRGSRSAGGSRRRSASSSRCRARS